MSCIRGRHVGGVISWGRHDLFPCNCLSYKSSCLIVVIILRQAADTPCNPHYVGILHNCNFPSFYSPRNERKLNKLKSFCRELNSDFLGGSCM